MEKEANIVLLLANPNDETTNGIFLKDRNWYHLYITTDDEIKDGDWFYLQDADVIAQYTTVKPVKEAKKIIACTDDSLRIGELKEGGRIEHLPQPSQSFIEYFIEEYNKANIITDVMVEYDCDHNQMPAKVIDILKINFDNTINIKPIKDNWNKKEVSNLLIKAMGDAVKNDRTSNHISIAEFSINWIDKNL